jgi:hypothetical protein
MDSYFMSCELVAQGKCYQTQLFRKDDGSPDLDCYHIGNMAIVLNGDNGLQQCWYVDLAFRKLVKLCDFYPGGKY